MNTEQTYRFTFHDSPVVIDMTAWAVDVAAKLVARDHPDLKPKTIVNLQTGATVFGGRRLRVTYEVITPESAEEGDVDESGWEDEYGVSMEPDEYDLDDGLTAVDLAVRYLLDEGATEPSSSHPGPGDWLTSYGGQDPRDGTYTNRSYHFSDEWTEDEVRAVFAGVAASA